MENVKVIIVDALYAALAITFPYVNEFIIAMFIPFDFLHSFFIAIKDLLNIIVVLLVIVKLIYGILKLRKGQESSK